ncbi:MAG: helix-turn-helix domain-containing protein [Janthinobacterium lividum]
MTPEELKTNRDKLGMTQHELAEAMGYTDKQAISLKERGKRKVNSRDEKILTELLKKRKKLLT